MRQLVTRPGRKFGAVFSPDGQHVAYIGRQQPGRWYQNAVLYVAPLDGSGARDVSGPLDLHLVPATTGDVVGDAFPAGPVWSADSRRVFDLATARGNQSIVALDAFAEPATAEWLVDGRGVAGGFTFDRARARLAYIWSLSLIHI